MKKFVVSSFLIAAVFMGTASPLIDPFGLGYSAYQYRKLNSDIDHLKPKRDRDLSWTGLQSFAQSLFRSTTYVGNTVGAVTGLLRGNALEKVSSAPFLASALYGMISSFKTRKFFDLPLEERQALLKYSRSLSKKEKKKLKALQKKLRPLAKLAAASMAGASLSVSYYPLMAVLLTLHHVIYTRLRNKQVAYIKHALKKAKERGYYQGDEETDDDEEVVSDDFDDDEDSESGESSSEKVDEFDHVVEV